MDIARRRSSHLDELKAIRSLPRSFRSSFKPRSRRTLLKYILVLGAFAVLVTLLRRAPRQHDEASHAVDVRAAPGTVDYIGHRTLRRLRAASVHQQPLMRSVPAGMLLKPSCVTQHAIAALNRHQRPRRIILVTPHLAMCRAALEPLARNVVCLHEDSILEGVTAYSVDARLRELYPQLETAVFQKGRTPTGWYFQQLLKLGVVDGVADLSELYVIWDFDMIPFRPIPILHGPPPSHRGSALNPPFRTVVNIGGANAPGYDAAYQRLFSQPLERAQDGTSFVTHWIVVRKELMLQFLSGLRRGGGALAWVDTILSNLPPEYLQQGFSEYASYISWVRQRFPETQHVVPAKTWLRQPLGGPWGVWLSRRLHPQGLCCPVRLQLGLQGLLGYQYGGFEVGHHAQCRWTEPQFAESYGLPAPRAVMAARILLREDRHESDA